MPSASKRGYGPAGEYTGPSQQSIVRNEVKAAMIRTRDKLLRIAEVKRQIIAEIIYDATDMTQRDLCKKTGLHQPEVSELLSGNNLDRFSVDRLLMVLIALGHKPQIHVC